MDDDQQPETSSPSPSSSEAPPAPSSEPSSEPSSDSEPEQPSESPTGEPSPEPSEPEPSEPSPDSEPETSTDTDLPPGGESSDVDVSALLTEGTFVDSLDQLTTAVDAVFFALCFLIALTGFLTIVALRR